MHDQVSQLFERAEALRSYLLEKNEVSFLSFADENFRKLFVVASASALETEICRTLLAFAHKSLSLNHVLVQFIQRKAIERQYHTWFDWRSTNVNSFLGLFGEKFKKFASDRISRDEDLSASCRAFLELGLLRNRLVHGDFSIFTLEKTTHEICELFDSACNFAETLPKMLAEFVDD